MTSESPDRATHNSSWPSFATEDLAWEPAEAGFGPRRGSTAFRGPYRASLPVPIATLSPVLPPQAIAVVEEASAEIARFDGEAASDRVSFAALILRTESASSSQIENLTSSAKAIALSELGRTGRANADEIVSNVTAMTSALDAAAHLDTPATLAMHRALLGSHDPTHAGELRTEQVWIGGSQRGPHGADYVAPHHRHLPSAMADLTTFIARDDLSVLTQAAVAHAQFENLHPFTDGNGRTGRALLHAMLRAGGLTTRTLVPVSAGLLGDTQRYFAALESYRGGDVVPIVLSVAEAVFPAVANSRQLVQDITTARTEWDEAITARRGAAAWRLADLLMTRPVIDSHLATSVLGVSVANAQAAIDRLVDDGILTQIGTGKRHRVWEASAVLDAVEAFSARASRR